MIISSGLSLGSSLFVLYRVGVVHSLLLLLVISACEWNILGSFYYPLD